MATELAGRLRATLEAIGTKVIDRFDPPETRLAWPGQSRELWPLADISGRLRSGEVFVVEVDDRADPGRSVVKYWPLLDAIAAKTYEHPPICLIVVSDVCATYGKGFQLLAHFAGQRLQRLYPRIFRFAFVDLAERNLPEIARVIAAHLAASSTDR